MAEKLEEQKKSKAEFVGALVRFEPRSADKLMPEEVCVGVNGTSYIYQRGKFVPVPAAVIHVLENAEVPLYETQEDDQGNPLSDRKVMVGMVRRYPYTTLRKLNADQFAAFREIAKQRTITQDDIDEISRN